MEALGRLFNVVPLANGLWVNMADAEAVTFVCYEDGGATDITIKEAKDSSGTDEQDLDVVDRYYTSAGTGTAWALQTQTAAALVEPTDATAQDAVVIHVTAASMSDGFTHLECTSDSADSPPIVVAILHDLEVQRDPEVLAAAVS